MNGVLWGVVVQLVAMWVCAYLLRMTAPQQCPRGTEDYNKCLGAHFGHVDRNDVKIDVLYSLIWPMWLGLIFFLLFVKSIEKSAELTPTPRRRQIKKEDLQKAIEAGEQENGIEDITADDIRTSVQRLDKAVNEAIRVSRYRTYHSATGKWIDPATGKWMKS